MKMYYAGHFQELGGIKLHGLDNKSTERFLQDLFHSVTEFFDLLILFC